MMKFEQNFGDKWKLDADLLYATRDVLGRRTRGTLQATAFQTGAQANPFYTNPVGYAGAATSQTIRWDSNALLGPGAYAFSSDQNGVWRRQYRIQDVRGLDRRPSGLGGPRRQRRRL